MNLKQTAKKCGFNAGTAGFLIFFFLLAVPGSGSAQGDGIAISPLRFEFTAKPGESIEETIKVSNRGSASPTSIRIKVEDMLPEGEEGAIQLEAPLEERRTFSLSPWVETKPSEFRLEPDERQEVQFVIKVPEDVEPGGYYASIVAGTTAPESEEADVIVVSRIGALISMTVPGDIEKDLRPLELIAPSYVESGPVYFSVRFENRGTVHVRPDASIVVTDILGREVAEVPLESKNVLPGAIRKIDTKWDTGLLLGKYTATLQGVYGRKDLPLDVVSVTFWGFPWKVVLAVLLILIFLYFIRKRLLAVLRVLIKGELPSSE